MAINPELITTIRVDQLPDETLSLTNLFPHTVGTDLKSATIQDLVDLVATTIGVSGGVGYIALSVTDGQQLPDVPELPSFFLCGAGTFLNINGYPDVICTENLNAIMSLTDHWELAVEIPINPLSGTVQSVTGSAVDNTDPLNPIVNLGGSAGTLAETLVLGNLTDGTDISISDGDKILLDNGANLKKGTTDAGLGGSKGIALRCAVDYELKWEAGRLYVMGGDGFTIREVSHNFTTTPTVNDDDTKGFVVDSRWILDNGDLYVCTDDTTGAAVWVLQSSGIPTLQEVATEGNTLTDTEIVFDSAFGNKEILINVDDGIYVKDIDSDTLAFIEQSGLGISNYDGTNTTFLIEEGFNHTSSGGFQKLTFDTIASNEEIIIPNASGTLALTTDITTPTLQQVTDVGNETTNSIKATQLVTQTNGPSKSMTLSSSNVNSELTAEWQEKNYLGIADITDIPTLVAGTNITIDDTDPLNPIISSTGGGGGGGGGASISFYLNGSVSQGTIGGVAFREMDRTPILGTGTDFTINADGYIQSFITDANVPNLLEIPAGNWNFETYFSASSGGGSPSFYVELYKWNGTTLSLIASNSATPEGITNGTTIDAYFSALAVPQTTLLATDRLAVRIYVTHSGRTITLHTEDNNLCQVITTFSTGLTALNGLTAQVQNLAVGTSGTDFAISSATATHTFNLPTASATNRGALSSTDWSAFNGKFTLPPLTSGSVLFSNGSTIAQDNANLFWDNTNDRLGIGTATPSARLQIAGVTSGSAFSVNGGFTGYTNQGVNINEYGSLAITGRLDESNNLLFGASGVGDTFGRIAFGFLTTTPYIGLGPGTTTRDIYLSRISGDLLIGTGTSNSHKFRLFGSNGNLVLQNGGTFTDNGFRLDVNGTTRLNGNTSIGGSTAGARLDVRAQGALSTDIAFRVRNSSDSANLIDVRGNGNVGIGNKTFSTYSSGGATPNDCLKLELTSDGAVLGVQNSNASGFSGVEYLNQSGAARVFSGFNNANGQEFRFNNFASGGYIDFLISATSALRIANSRNILLGTATDIASSKLTIESTTQGFLPPRMTTTQKNAIASPAAGLVVYDSTLGKLCVRTASAWETITSI